MASLLMMVAMTLVMFSVLVLVVIIMIVALVVAMIMMIVVAVIVVLVVMMMIVVVRVHRDVDSRGINATRAVVDGVGEAVGAVEVRRPAYR